MCVCVCVCVCVTNFFSVFSLSSTTIMESERTRMFWNQRMFKFSHTDVQMYEKTHHIHIVSQKRERERKHTSL